DGGEGGGGVGKAHVKSSPAAWTLASIASTTGWGGRCASNAAGSGSGRVTPTSPPRGSNGVPTTSAASRATVPSPQAYGRSASAAAAATPAAMPTEDSSADDTTTGTATRSATSSARLTPPRGCTFTTTTSAASSSIIWRGSGSWRTSSSAAIGTSTSLRNVR